MFECLWIAGRFVQWNAKYCGSSARCHLVAFIEIGLEIFSISGCIRFHHSFIDLEPAAGGIWDNQPCQTGFAPPGLPDPAGRIQKICVELGVLYELHFFSYVLFGKVPLIHALYMRCSQAFLQQPHILSYSFRDKLATFWTHMAKWSSSVTSLCSAGRSNRAFRAQTLSPSRHFEPLTERLLKWFGGDFGIQITIFLGRSFWEVKQKSFGSRNLRNMMNPHVFFWGVP